GSALGRQSSEKHLPNAIIVIKSDALGALPPRVSRSQGRPIYPGFLRRWVIAVNLPHGLAITVIQPTSEEHSESIGRSRGEIREDHILTIRRDRIAEDGLRMKRYYPSRLIGSIGVHDLGIVSDASPLQIDDAIAMIDPIGIPAKLAPSSMSQPTQRGSIRLDHEDVRVTERGFHSCSQNNRLTRPPSRIVRNQRLILIQKRSLFASSNIMHVDGR